MNSYDIYSRAVRFWHIIISFVVILLCEIYLQGYIEKHFNILNVNYFSWLKWIVFHLTNKFWQHNLVNRIVEEYNILYVAFLKLNKEDKAALVVMLLIAFVSSNLIDRLLMFLKRGKLS